MLCTRRGEFGLLPIRQEVDLPDKFASQLIQEGAAAPVGGPRPIASTDEAADTVESDEAANAEPTFAEIGIGGKTAALLHKAGFNTIADVEAVADLTSVKGIGEATSETIRAAIRSYRQS